MAVNEYPPLEKANVLLREKRRCSDVGGVSISYPSSEHCSLDKAQIPFDEQ